MNRLSEYEQEHVSRLRASLAECTVLLKTNGVFPLKEAGELALYGSGARCTVKGGTGSGEVNSRYFITAEEGLEAAGFRVTTKAWLDGYDEIRNRAKSAFVKEIRARARKNRTNAVSEGMGAVMPEPDYELPLNGSGETALYVLARNSGEGRDRENIPGDIALTETEIRDILQLQKQYPSFMLVLNVGGPVDLTPVVNEVENILLLSQLGVETGTALADILLGRQNPSGKLASTWAAYQDYQTVGDFGDRDNTCYREGIYVGYRYFDSAGVTPTFPFGFGLSFTDFTAGEEKTELSGELVTVTVQVRNTGTRAGKQVLQLYVSKPEVNLDQPFQTLAAFAKSRQLEPEESDTLKLQFRFSELASYDSKRECWVLEKGDYFLRLGVSSADTKAIARLRLEQEVITCRTKNVCGAVSFADWKPQLERIDMLMPDVPILTVETQSIPVREPARLPEDEAPDRDAERMSTEELIDMFLGAHDPKGGLSGVVGDAGYAVAGAAGETCAVSKKYGVRPLVMADGPAGLRLSKDYVQGENGPVTVGPTLQESMTEFLPAGANG